MNAQEKLFEFQVANEHIVVDLNVKIAKRQK